MVESQITYSKNRLLEYLPRLSGARVLIVGDVMLDEYFLLKVNRKVNHDATLSLDTILYETDLCFANSRMEVRYDPEWLLNPNTPILLYHEGKKVGEARQVNFHDNAHAKRKGPGRPVNNRLVNLKESSQESIAIVSKSSNHISFTSISKADSQEKPSRDLSERGDC